MNTLKWIALIALLVVVQPAIAQDHLSSLYEPQVFEGMPVGVMKPLGFKVKQSYPVIVSLHGAGGRGNDNKKQLRDWNRQLAEEKRRKDFPCYVVAPQANGMWDGEHLNNIKSLIKTLPSVDMDRIYIMGHSMGGHGTYILIQLDSEYFAAAVPSAGAGKKSTEDFIDASKIKHIPIWAFHGDNDGVCPIEKDQKVLMEMKELHGNMKLTTWVGGKHSVSGKMIVGGENGTTEFSSDRCDREPDFMTWLFRQSRRGGNSNLPDDASPITEGGNLKAGEYHITQSWSQEKRFQRPFHVSVPESRTADGGEQSHLPVFIFLHGNGGNAKQAMKGFLRNHKKMASRYVMVFPQGYRESWNIVSERSKADDLGFIESIVRKLSAMENVDSDAFSIMGASNGAALVNQLAIESKLPNIRNYISGVSPLNTWQHDGEHFKFKGEDNNYTEASNPLVGKRLMNISGTEDKLVPYGGGFSKHIPAKEGKLEFVDAEQSTFLWAQQMGYEGEKRVRPTKVNGSLEVFRYLDGDVVHYKVLGEGHGATHEVNEEILIEFLEGAWEGTSVDADEPHNPAEFFALKHESVERKYLLHVPKKLPGNAPLVFVLHGYRGDARDYTELGMNRLADANRFAVCYPQGTDDLEGVPHWNARLQIRKTDDIGFLSALASHLQAQYSLDSSKTFVCGISNGGFMSYTLVAEKPDVFKAAASVIGTVSGHTWEHRNAIRPVPILQVSGMRDEIIPYDGSMSKAGGWGGAPNQDLIMEFWRKLNKTKSEEVIKLSNMTTGHHYKDGVNGNEVWHYKIQELGHSIPGQREMEISVAELIWKFFSKF